MNVSRICIAGGKMKKYPICKTVATLKSDMSTLPLLMLYCPSSNMLIHQIT